MPSRIHLVDVPVWVDECDYARFCKPAVAANVKNLALRPTLECVHGRRLHDKCYMCRQYGMVKEQGTPATNRNIFTDK